MKATYVLIVFLLAPGVLSACSDRSDIASPDCAALDAEKLSKVQQIELAKKCPRAGAPFKPSPARNW